MNEDIEILIEDCKRRKNKLSHWEINFIESIEDQYSDTNYLTKTQTEKLNDIWEKATNK